MNKFCNQCGQSKPLTSFDHVSKKPDGTWYYRGKCNVCRWPGKKARRQRLREMVIDIKKKSECKCGENDYRLLDFHHHNDNKLDNVSDLVRKGASEKRILDEIKKCEIICVKCHRILHYNENYRM